MLYNSHTLKTRNRLPLGTDIFEIVLPTLSINSITSYNGWELRTSIYPYKEIMGFLEKPETLLLVWELRTSIFPYKENWTWQEDQEMLKTNTCKLQHWFPRWLKSFFVFSFFFLSLMILYFFNNSFPRLTLLYFTFLYLFILLAKKNTSIKQKKSQSLYNSIFSSINFRICCVYHLCQNQFHNSLNVTNCEI